MGGPTLHAKVNGSNIFQTKSKMNEEGDESNEDSNVHRINIDTNGPLNDFKISVEEAIQAFKGTSSTMTVDDKINRVCQNYRMLATSDSKCDALAFLACNLGTCPEKIRQKAEDLAW